MGVFVCIDDEYWVKMGLEYVDDYFGFGVVVIVGSFDWLVGYVDDWCDSEIIVWVSCWVDVLIVWVCVDDGDWWLVWVVLFDGDVFVFVGLFLVVFICVGLMVCFIWWEWFVVDIDFY